MWNAQTNRTSWRVLTEQSRPALLAHFLALNDEDRRLRFNQPTRDWTIKHYVDGIDFERDTVFGVYDSPLTLDGVGHFVTLRDNDRPRAAEFGLSVSQDARGRGIGSALLEHAITHARRMQFHTLWMYFQSDNDAMMRIARKAGMTIQCAYGEADAWLALPSADDPIAVLDNHCIKPRGDLYGVSLQCTREMASGMLQVGTRLDAGADWPASNPG
ncbi:GNAT family N-acetyltransferase [Paraburkholderia nemoris]|uniref:GNAT family N-acetyltransferase n=1 Tax=Paraburkholderia nemoris TaxID=2793076 RepID=UPI0038B81717